MIKLTIKANNNNWGSVSVVQNSDQSIITASEGDVYEVENETVLCLEAKEGKDCKFLMWSDGECGKIRNIKASERAEYVAVFISEENDVLSRMFNILFNSINERRYVASQCPELEDFGTLFKDSSITTSNASIMTDENKKDIKSSKYLDFLAWLIPIIAMVVMFALLLIQIKCRKNNTDSLVTVHSTTVDKPLLVPITTSNGFVYVHKIKVDTTYIEHKDNMVSSNKPNKAVIQGEIIYRNTGWHIWLFLIIVVALVSAVIVLIIKILLHYYGKLRDSEHRMQELKYRDDIRMINENREIERLRYKTDMLLYEKKEKMIIDEWARDNEHNRIIDIKEQERVAKLNNVLLELAKIKNTITIKSAKNDGETMLIERSILSEDCCEELKEIVKGFVSN